MSTLTDVDIAALVGPIEAPPCEHVEHETHKNWHDDGPATHYRGGQCPYCLDVVPVAAICQAFTEFILSNGLMHCECGYRGLASEFVRILGPVASNA